MSGELYDTENNPVVVILELDVKGKGGIKFDEIKVVSAYGIESMQNLIDSSRVQYISKDKEKTSRWIKRTRLQLPFGLTTTDYIDSIPQDEKNTTHFSLDVDSKGRKLSEEQKEYFKESKVVDSKGRLKEVYHVTGSDFTVFSHDYIGQLGSAEGRGFYFTDNLDKAKGFQKNGTEIMKGYLNITKPLSLSEVTLKPKDLERI